MAPNGSSDKPSSLPDLVTRGGRTPPPAASKIAAGQTRGASSEEYDAAPPKSEVLLQPNQQAHDVYMALSDHVRDLKLPELKGMGSIIIEVEWRGGNSSGPVAVTQRMTNQTFHQRGQ